MKQIIFVDDESNILQGLRRSLRRFRHEWKLEFATSGQEALEKLGNSRFDAIVTDMRMPGMDGAELLQRVKERYPYMLRIVLSGQCDEETIIRSIGNAHQFFAKPCDIEKLTTMLGRVFVFLDRVPAEETKSLLMGAIMVPMIPARINELVSNLDSGPEDSSKISEAMGKSIFLSANLFRLVNSQFFVTSEGVYDIEKAVEILTPRIIKRIIMENDFVSELDESIAERFGIARKVEHSVRSAYFAERIARSEGLGADEIGLYRTAAFFHDIGMFLLMKKDSERYAKVIDKVSGRTEEILEAEREIYGCTHQEIGASLLAAWAFAEDVIDAAAFHVNPADSPRKNSPALAAVHVAHLLERGLSAGDATRFIGEYTNDYLKLIGLHERLGRWIDAALEGSEESVGV